MATVTRSAAILAPPDEVWSVLADFAAISSWAPNVDHSCLLSEQTAGIGMVRRIQTGRTTVVETVNRYEPGSALGYEVSGIPPVVESVVNTWTLEAADAATVATLTTEVEPGPRPPQKVVAQAFGRALGKVSGQMLGGLADHFANKEDA